MRAAWRSSRPPGPPATPGRRQTLQEKATALQRCMRGAKTVVLYCGSVWRAEHIWYDDLTLFRRCVEVVPDSSTFRNHLAMALFRQHEPKAAVRLLLRNEIPSSAP